MTATTRNTAQLIFAIALLFTSLGSTASDQLNVRPESLEALIETGLDYANLSVATRQEALGKARILLAERDAALPKLRAKFGIAEAYLLYQQGMLEGGVRALDDGLVAVTLLSHPDLYVRSHSLRGGLLLASGKQEQGLASLATLFEQDLSKVEPSRIENARVNYASGLVQGGRIQEASRQYEQALDFALSSDNDLLGLSAGSNFISLLRNQGMLGPAEYWLNRLRPAMKRVPRSMATAALELYDYGLVLSKGDAPLAVAKLEAFLARSSAMPDLVRAHGEELYSDALLTQGRLPEALAAAKRATDLMQNYPLEQPEAIMAIIRAMLAMQNYSAAGVQLEKLEQADISRLSNIAERHKLRLEHALGIGDSKAATGALEDFFESNKGLVDFMNQQQAGYYQEKLDTQQTERELELSRELQAKLESEAALQKAQASEALVREKSLRQQRSFTIGSVVLIALIGVGLIYLYARRQLQTKLRESLRKQNDSLSALVESKSEDLVQKVTEQSQLKHALAERRHMEAIGQIAGHVAHDFNNVLQVISATNDLLASRVQGETEQGALAASNESVHSASSRVRQLLAYSRNLQLEARVFKVSDYLRDTGALFRSAVGDVNQLVIKEHCDDAWLQLDTGQLTASIINLLRNAAEAMESPGEIELSVCAVTADEDERQVCFEVIDQGRGMSQDALAEAPRPYYTTKPEGTGLGLSSVYGFVVQSGGLAALESKSGLGTRVSLSFPMHDGVKIGEAALAVEPRSWEGSRVLLVEDNPAIARVLQAILDQKEIASHWVSAADQAQTLLMEDSSFDVLLSDVKIPGSMDGIGLAKWVREHHPEVRIGLMSGYGPSVEEGVDVPVLAKPFSSSELLEYLSQR